MIGVTIGTGKWAAVAEMARARMELMTGMECRILPEEFTVAMSHPSWAKTRIPDWAGDDVLIFDADLFCMKPWSPEDMLGDADVAVVAEIPNTLNQQECALYQFPRERYLNGGLLILRHRPGIKLMEEVFTYHPHYGRWMEQDALNRVIHAMRPWLVRWLPHAYNYMIRPDLPCAVKELYEHHKVNLHFAGGKNPELLVKLYEDLAAYSPQVLR